MGLYLFDKPSGISSAKFLNQIKKTFGFKKAGHSGTLDPLASGLLIVGVGKCTKLLHTLLSEKKTYSGSFQFGFETDTLDICGEVVKKLDSFEVSLSQVREVVEKDFVGKILQTPPAYSATKVNGMRAYALARKGESFELEAKEREVYSFSIEKVNENTFSFSVCVSHGTYIRSLVKDIGEKLNIPATLVSLRRERVGKFSVENADNLESKELRDVNI